MWGTRRFVAGSCKKGLVEHYGYFVGGEALGWVAGIAGAYRGFVVLAGRRFSAPGPSGRRLKSLPSQRMMKRGDEPPAEPCSISQV